MLLDIVKVFESRIHPKSGKIDTLDSPQNDEECAWKTVLRMINENASSTFCLRMLPGNTFIVFFKQKEIKLFYGSVFAAALESRIL